MKKSSEVPSGRLRRIGKLGGLAARLAGSALSNTAGQLLKAQKPSFASTVLTKDNALSITQKLAQMRGAAMKLGQMLSMDAGEFLPAEWEPILAQLRQDADAMPKHQLLQMLQQSWGDDWMQQFAYFSFKPIAAASIGQVHMATLHDGTELAIKIQYPGVARSIDSDVDNLGRILKISGLVSAALDLDKLLEEAKQQLKREADYTQEIAFQRAYKKAIEHDERFIVPTPYEPLCHEYILAMEYIDGVPISSLARQDQKVNDYICDALMSLTLFELFDSGLMQSDPNFANYFYQPDTHKIVLLDFGACCQLSASTQSAYQHMALAMQKQNKEAIYDAFLSLGLLHTDMPEEVKQIAVGAAFTASECLQTESYNFQQAGLVKRLYAQTQGLIRNRKAVASPAFDTALVNRKISGMILLANRLNATLGMQQALSSYIQT